MSRRNGVTVKKIGAVGDSELDRTLDHLYKLSHVDDNFTPKQHAEAKQMYEKISAAMDVLADKPNGLNIQLIVLILAITQVLRRL